MSILSREKVPPILILEYNYSMFIKSICIVHLCVLVTALCTGNALMDSHNFNAMFKKTMQAMHKERKFVVFTETS